MFESTTSIPEIEIIHYETQHLMIVYLFGSAIANKDFIVSNIIFFEVLNIDHVGQEMENL